jgi:hypothetical protein
MILIHKLKEQCPGIFVNFFKLKNRQHELDSEYQKNYVRSGTGIMCIFHSKEFLNKQLDHPV